MLTTCLQMRPIAAACNTALGQCAECDTNSGATCTKCFAGSGFSGAGVCGACGATATNVIAPSGSDSCGYGTCTNPLFTGGNAQCTACTLVDPTVQSAGFMLSTAKTCTACSNLGTNNQPGATGTCAKCTANVDICEQCVDGSFLAADKRCQRCVTNCAKCSTATTCDACNAGFYRDSSSGQCVPCALNCATCTEAVKCTACPTGRYLDESKQCVQCSTSALIPNAADCSSASVATACSPNNFLSNGKCLPCGTNCESCLNDNGVPGNCVKCSGDSVVSTTNAKECVFPGGVPAAGSTNTYGAAATCANAKNAGRFGDADCSPAAGCTTGCAIASTTATTSIANLNWASALRVCCTVVTGQSCADLTAAAGVVSFTACQAPATNNGIALGTAGVVFPADTTINVAAASCCVAPST